VGGERAVLLETLREKRGVKGCSQRGGGGECAAGLGERLTCPQVGVASEDKLGVSKAGWGRKEYGSLARGGKSKSTCTETMRRDGICGGYDDHQLTGARTGRAREPREIT